MLSYGDPRSGLCSNLRHLVMYFIWLALLHLLVSFASLELRG